MNARLIERVPDGLRGGLAPQAPVVMPTAAPGERLRRVLTDAETDSLTGLGRRLAHERAELLAAVGDAYRAALADGVL